MSNQNYQLLVQKGPEIGKIYPLSSVSITIGRDPMADITITDPEVSRQHVRLSGTLSGYKIQDLGSTNGTYIDGERLGGEAVELAAGQIVTMGAGVTLRYQTDMEGQDDLVTMVDGALLDSDFVIETDDSLLDDSLEPIEGDTASPIGSEIPEDDLEPGVDTQYLQEATAIDEDQIEHAETDDSPDIVEFSTEQDYHDDLAVDASYEPTTDETMVTSGEEPVIIPHQGEAEVHEQEDAGSSNWRMPVVIVSLLFLLICCCCSFFLFLYYYGGDWMLRQMGLLS